MLKSYPATYLARLIENRVKAGQETRARTLFGKGNVAFCVVYETRASAKRRKRPVGRSR